MTLFGGTDLAVAILALASGAAVLLVRKGTSRHRWLGRTYVASMLAMNGTALLSCRLFGRVERARRPVERARAVEHHYAWMTSSYVGLMAAAVSEVATRAPALRSGPGRGLAFGITVAIATLLVLAVGSRLIRRRKTALLVPYAPRSHDAMNAGQLSHIATGGLVASSACRMGREDHHGLHGEKRSVSVHSGRSPSPQP